jgi:hypothetical protein
VFEAVLLLLLVLLTVVAIMRMVGLEAGAAWCRKRKGEG